MGVDVGVVNIDYLPVPGFPVSDFMRELMLGPIFIGDDTDDADDDCDCWGGGWAYNGLYEYSRDCLEKQANAWANNQNLSGDDRATLLAWLNGLPYRDDLVMLHLSV